jgi:hypothetical protein
MMEILQSLIKHLYQPTVFARDPFKAAASHTTLATAFALEPEFQSHD